MLTAGPIPRCLTLVFMTYLVSGPARNFCWGDTQSDEIPTTTAKLMALDVPGGLVVQLGASDVRLATELRAAAGSLSTCSNATRRWWSGCESSCRMSVCMA